MSSLCNIRGILGICHTYTAANNYNIINAINFGIISHNSNTTKQSTVTGIVGYSKRYNLIMNCVNIGHIKDKKQIFLRTGTVTGILQRSKINGCYWNNRSRTKIYTVADESTINETGSFIDGTFMLNKTGTL